jgi:hypothetical protein
VPTRRVRGPRHLTGALRWRAGLAYRVMRDPPWAPPGDPESPVPARSDIARALLPAPELTAIDLNESAQIELMTQLSELGWDVPADPTPGWRFHNSWFFEVPDAAVYQALLRTLQPARIVESGSGFTSALALDTRDRWLPDLELTFIDPNPGRLNDLLTDRDREQSEIITKPVQDVEFPTFDRLGAGDVLFCDTDHFAKAGSEVNWLLFNVLPRLRPGVLVHIHDAFWPFEYPTHWLQARRSYNELYAVRAFLMYNRDFEVVLFNDWLWQHRRDLFKELRSTWAPPASLWLRKVR